jgi:hypothetical protein
MGYGATDTAGKFAFTRVPQGTYGVIASIPDGYDVLEHLIGGPATTFHDQLIVARDTVSPVHFTFLKKGPGSVTVRTLAADGSALPGVLIELYAPTASVAKITSDANGRVTFNNVPFGVYGVVATRPVLFRDFQAPNDSLFAFHDNIVVEDGSRDSVNYSFAKCAGDVRAIVLDNSGAPVAGTATAFFTSTQTLGGAVTGADGRVAFAGPCATQLGLLINPPVGFTVAEGRGSNFMDGIVLSNGQSRDLTFHVVRSP